MLYIFYPTANISTRVSSNLSTKSSFKKNQKQHNTGTSPLLKIPQQDLVKQFFLDWMHLLHLGLQKLVMNKWIFEKKLYCTISVSQKIHLQNLLENITNVPDEFQRKIFYLNDFTNWKGTQFLFFTLCHPMAVEHADYARKLLTKFVELFPTYYGEDSQDMNVHNDIHIAEDVEFTGLPLPALSAFVFEDCLKWIKEIIRGKTKPLQQLLRHLAELHSCPEAPDLLELKHPLHKRLKKRRFAN